MKDDDGATVPVKLINQRLFLRWSKLEAARFMFPAVEIESTSAIDMLDGLDAIAPAFSVT